jgi:hypothetical protein
MSKPIVATQELVWLILKRTLSLVDFVTQGHLSEYVRAEYALYVKFSEANELPVMSEEKFADLTMQALATVQKSIEGMRIAGTAAPEEPRIGQYL